MEKKVVSKGKFLLHIFLSFLVWDLVAGFLNNLILSVLNLISNTMLAVILTYVLWMLHSVYIIVMVYFNNKNKTVATESLSKVRRMNLILFYVLTIGLSISTIAEGFVSFPIALIIITIVHMLLIAFVNDWMFRRYISDEER